MPTYRDADRRSAILPGGFSFISDRPGGAVDWAAVGDMPNAPLPDAVAYSVGCSPGDPAWPAGPFDFPDAYQKRLRVAEAHLIAGSLVNLTPGAAPRVSLAAFGVWAAALGWSLPEGFPVEAAASGGDKRWSEDMKRAARARIAELKAAGVRDFMKKAAASFNVSAERLRVVLLDTDAERPAQGAWPPSKIHRIR